MLGFGCFRELPFKLFIVNTATHTLDYAMAGFVLTYLQLVSFYFFFLWEDGDSPLSNYCLP